MKFRLMKTCVGEFDTDRERRRIRQAFKDRPAVQKRLHKLMDAIEAQDWVGASEQLCSKWWSGRDESLECPRLEFIGLLGVPYGGFGLMASYDDLVMAMRREPAGGLDCWPDYKVEKVST